MADGMMSFGDHLEALRRVLWRIVAVVVVCAGVVFWFKDATFGVLLAPREWDFVTYRAIERVAAWLGMPFHFDAYHVDLIATELSSQFMTHLSASVAIGALIASPYILYQIFTFVSPALYDNERRYATPMLVAMYVLFMLGVAMNYFVLFPVAFRFLGTYQVADAVRSVITLDSYISTFTTLALVMGLVFQLPVVAFVMAKLELLTSGFMAQYRRHAFILILVVSALITPPDIFTLVLVAIPLYALYEICIWIVRRVERT